jgi:chromosome segregation ATPase
VVFDISGSCVVFDNEEVWVAMNTEVDNRQYNVWESSSPGEEVDQFQLLEEKVDSLIEKTMALKSEKEAFEEKLRIEEEKVSDLNSKIETLRSGRNDAKQKIMSLLEKMEQVSS